MAPPRVVAVSWFAPLSVYRRYQTSATAISAIPDLAARIAPLRWHIEFLFPGKDIIALMPTLAAVKVPISIAHFAYQPATGGVLSVLRVTVRTRPRCWRRHWHARLQGADRTHAPRQHLDEDLRREPG